MRSPVRSSCVLLAAALSLGVVAYAVPAAADISMSVGIRYCCAPPFDSGTVADCSTKAQTALNAYLLNATEEPAGSGNWIAYSTPDQFGNSTAAAVVRCSPLSKGYVVTFTCTIEIPGSPYSANDLCLDIAHNFAGKETTTLATPTPVPTGCTTATLAGTWAGNGVTFTMTQDGSLTDNQGVSGSWALSGLTAKLTYYGYKTLTLSKDGKHLSGSGYDLTRKC